MNNKINIEEDIKMLKELNVGDDIEFKQAIENILADRKRLEKENLKLQTEIAEQVYFESMPLDKMRELEAKANKYDALVEKIKDKHTEAKTRYSKTLSSYQYGKVDALEELLGE